ncbi:hypothetical protein [Parendozoicomonas sp. Alg238-R29]|uniref:hypothetical protein n=1 Tax=Parendozoicomonas sp. Alg238-R29 TaxID=2993446 RepID=UPI00248DF845|nr:hypothetical protein [Parendozoicomonas sp. Alg238-R29]
MQFFVSAISDEDLNAIRRKEAPIKKGIHWEEVRSAFCECQVALRSRQKDRVLPLAVYGRLILALYRYDCEKNNENIKRLFPFHCIGNTWFVVDNLFHPDKGYSGRIPQP